jgi:CRP-like cAMP-binding protein
VLTQEESQVGFSSSSKNGIESPGRPNQGAVFGELSALPDEPHTAVRTTTPSEFYVADANTMLTAQSAALIYVATLLARRLDLANRGVRKANRAHLLRRAF